MNWNEELVKDIQNVSNGQKEAGGQGIDGIVEQLKNTESLEVAAQLLVQNNLQFFANALMSGNYHREVTKEDKVNDDSKVEEAQTDSQTG